MHLKRNGKTYKTDLKFQWNDWKINIVIGKLDILWLRGRS